MKKILLSAALLFFATACNAKAFEPITFSWDENSDNPAYYRILWGSTAGGPYVAGINVGRPTPNAENRCLFTLENPPPKLNYYVAVACDSDDQCSDYSNEVNARTKHSAPGQLKKEAR